MGIVRQLDKLSALEPEWESVMTTTKALLLAMISSGRTTLQDSGDLSKQAFQVCLHSHAGELRKFSIPG